MTWQLFNNYTLDVTTNTITIPTNFTDTELVIRVTPSATQPNWRYFGELEQWINIVGIGDIRAYTNKLKLGTNLLQVNATRSYEIRLIAYHWLPEIYIDIFRDM